jgi:hypothetical protein
MVGGVGSMVGAVPPEPRLREGGPPRWEGAEPASEFSDVCAAAAFHAVPKALCCYPHARRRRIGAC